jgi:hypothetical protein
LVHDKVSEFVEATAARFGIPGVAVAVWAGGREIYACHGVTSADNPLPVDRDTSSGRRARLAAIERPFSLR